MRLAATAPLLRRHIRVVALLVCLLATAAAQAQVEKTRDFRQRTPDGFNRATGINTLTNNNQRPSGVTDTTGDNVDTSANKGLVYVKETPDSVLRQKVFFFHHSPYSVKIDELWNPTLDPTGAQFSDSQDGFTNGLSMTDMGDFFLGQGTIGHPHLSVFPHAASNLGFGLQ